MGFTRIQHIPSDPKPEFSGGYNEILCSKKSWMGPHRFTVRSCIISVAANTSDIP